jgi:hypothetical protein
MSTTNNAANAAIFEENAIYNGKVTGFSYIGEYALIKANIEEKSVGAIIGTKKEFPMSEMFALKQAPSVNLQFVKTKKTDKGEYQQFWLTEICFE